MLFSSIVESAKNANRAKKNGAPLTSVEFTLADVNHDYNEMIRFYNLLSPESSIETLTSFYQEVKEFYHIIDQTYCRPNQLSESENDQLGRIYLETRKVKDAVSMRIHRMKSSNQNEQ